MAASQSASYDFQGFSIHISQAAIEALKKLQNKEINYVQLSIGKNLETIELESSETVNLTDIPGRVPEDHFRYHVYLFKHTHEGDYMESVVFITSVADNAPPKEKLNHSGRLREDLTRVIENGLGMEFAKRITVYDGKEITEEFLYDEVHPKKTIVRK